MSVKEASGQRDEGGFALFYALLVTLVVSGIVAVVFATAIGEQRQSALEMDFEDTVHVAEAGAEVFLQRLAQDGEDDSGVAGPATGSDVAQWAIGEAVRKTDGVTYDLPAIDLIEGESVAIRPTGDDAEFVYGVGFTPSRDAWVSGVGDPYVRVVRVQVAFSPSEFAGDVALLAGGNATLSGNYKFYGSNGKVHTNGAIANNGSGTVSEVTFSGSCTKGCDSINVSGPVAPVPIEQVDPLDVWGTDDAVAISGTGGGQWLEYCSGQWYRRAPDAAAPCDAAKSIAIAPPGGWSGTIYTNNSGLPTNDVFYFDGDVDVSLKKMQGNITVITGGDIDVGPSANLPPFDARYPGLLLLAGGDITIGGNATAFAPLNPALVFANGTIELGGTIAMEEIAFVARDGASVGTTYAGGGSGSITYNGGAIADLGGTGYPIVVQWDEVR